MRHFEYDTIITGTSMTENFRTTECDALFGGKSIKVPLSGASFKELHSATRRALQRNPEVRRVIRGIDAADFISDKDAMSYDDIPEYLYNNNILDDFSYLYNKEVMYDALVVLRSGVYGWQTPTFDEYCFWGDLHTYSKEEVLKKCSGWEGMQDKGKLTAEEQRMICENVAQNLIDDALQYADTQFYYFIPPYSIAWWASQAQKGMLQKTLEAEMLVVEQLLAVDNIHVFSFNDQFELVCNLNQYKDLIHYHPDVNTQILQWLHQGFGELKKDTARAFYQKVFAFYTTYDYQSIFE